jgi:hypothetical protein
MGLLYSSILVLRNTSIDTQYFIPILDLVYNYLIQNNDVDSDSLYVIGAVAMVLKKGFNDFMPKFWPCLLAGLNKVQLKFILVK